MAFFGVFRHVIAAVLVVASIAAQNTNTPHDIVAGIRHVHSLKEAAKRYSKESNMGTKSDNILKDVATKAVGARAEEMLAEGLDADTGNMSDVVSAECWNHTQSFLNGLADGDDWALRMFDAFGKPGSGILDLHVTWLGSYDECVAVEAVVNTTELSSPFHGRYCVVSFGPPASQTQLGLALTIGVCVPNSCSPDDLGGLVHRLLNLIPVNTSALPPPTMSCKFEDIELSDKAIAVISVCAVFVVLLIAGTAYDIVVVQEYGNSVGSERKVAPRPNDTVAVAVTALKAGSNDVCAKTHLLAANGDITKMYMDDGDELLRNARDVVLRRQNSKRQTVEIDQKVDKPKPKLNSYTPGTLGKLLLSFSIYTNASKILSTSQPAGTLSAVNGIRFISMTWVILGHTYGFGTMFTENMATFSGQMLKRLTFQAVGNGTFSVDTFFCLSGILVAYLTLKEMKKVGGAKKFKWGMYYFHRFWRLTPPYMLFLMLYVPTIKYWYNGPLWSQVGVEVNECKDTWWKNLLYVNNIVEPENQCMGWSWYLANDMQFFIISPLMLIPLFYSPFLGSVICMIFVLINFISTGVISANDGLNANMLAGNAGETFVDIYIKPWCRIGPYVVGTFTGYLLYKTGCKIRIPRIVNLLCWTVATVVALLVIYGLWEPDTGIQDMSTTVSAMYNATSRTAWGMCVCWVIFACATGYGGPVNTLLSWRAMIPLSRLTYCAYLVHPVVMYTYYMSRRTLMYWYDLQIIYLFLGHLFMSYAAALLVSLAFESPMMGLEKVLLQRNKNS